MSAKRRVPSLFDPAYSRYPRVSACGTVSDARADNIIPVTAVDRRGKISTSFMYGYCIWYDMEKGKDRRLLTKTKTKYLLVQHCTGHALEPT